jgi:RNA polymerase sigma-70 factor (ECF subfamily)
MSTVDGACALADVFAAHLPANVRGACDRGSSESSTSSESRESLDARLGAYVDAGCAAWPDLPIDRVAFVRYVAERATAGDVPPIAHAGDLLLAYGCACGVRGAASAFYSAFGNVIARVLSRRGASDALRDDATQIVHERLLVAPPGGAPKIADYEGMGPLRSWVSTTAATTLLMMRRSDARRREEPEHAGEAILIAHAAPELLYMKARYKAELADAVVASLGRLSDRDRTLLRLHLGDRVSIDRLGAMYAIDRSTAARWLAAAREALVAGARDDLRERLRLTDRECESIIALVQSELHVSLVRLLA